MHAQNELPIRLLLVVSTAACHFCLYLSGGPVNNSSRLAELRYIYTHIYTCICMYIYIYIRAVKRLQILIGLIMINYILPIFSVYFCENIKIYDKRRIYTFIQRGAHNLLTSVRASRGASDFFPFRCARTCRHWSSAARETEIGEVLTRHVETKWHAAG